MTSDNKTVEGSIVHQPSGSMGDFLAELDSANNVIERVVNAAIRATHSGQWCDMQGKPYLTGPGAEVVALRCNVSWKNVTSRKEWREDEFGKSYIYIYEADFTLGHGLGAHSMEAIPGTCSSRDQFIGTNFKDGKDARPLSEVEEGSIMKAAMTNMIVNGVTRVTGIRNMTWEQLKPLGIEAGGAARVSFAEGGKGGAAGQGQSAAAGVILKFGRCVGKTLADIEDSDLAFYTSAFERDAVSTDPDKQRWKAGAIKNLAAAKEEAARRANVKAAAEKKTETTPPKASLWDRLKQLANALAISEDRLKELTKKTLQKDTVTPGELTDADFTAIGNELEAEKKRTSAPGSF